MLPSKLLQKGVTLIEVLLVMVIMSAVFVMIIGYTTQKTEQIRIDRATLQMQQILNAGMAYYVNNGTWPADIDALQTTNYLPNQTLNNPWGQPYTVSSNSSTGNFTVTADFPAAISDATLQILAGRLPFGVVGTNQVSASVNIPGQNLNNARSINFAGIYHSGACVPVPTCPSSMTPQIYVIPAAVNAVYSYSAGSTQTAPINGYTAFATPYTQYFNASGGSGPGQCKNPSMPDQCLSSSNIYAPTGFYWRVCLAIDTPQGRVTPTSIAWGVTTGSVLAVTRCIPTGEPSGSDFTVWSQ